MLIRPATPGDLPALARGGGRDLPDAAPPGPAAAWPQNYPLLFSADNAGNLLLAVDAGRRHRRPRRLHAAAGGAARTSRRWWPASGRCSPPPTSAARAWRRGCSRRRSTGRGQAAPSWGWSRGRAGCTSARASSPTRSAGATGWRRDRRRAASVVAGALPPAALGDLARLHGAEPTRFFARPAEWQALADAGVVFSPAGPAVPGPAGSGGSPLAYLAVRHAGGAGGRPGPGCWRLAGIAGPSPTPRPYWPAPRVAAARPHPARPTTTRWNALAADGAGPPT